MRAGDISGAKFLTLCSTPLSNSEMSLAVIGVEAPLARLATTLRAVGAVDEGCAWRPAWASSVLKRPAAVSRKTSVLQPNRSVLFPGAFAFVIDRMFLTVNQTLSFCLNWFSFQWSFSA